MNTALEINDLSFKYTDSGRSIFENISVHFSLNELTAIVGLSGSGKSTLCQCMCGVVPHLTEGVLNGGVKLFGRSLREMKLSEISAKVGIVFQDPDTQLFSPTVEDELAFGPENLCIERDEIASRIDEALHQVGMEDYRFANPVQLSGGQKQLIVLASVLSLKPEILIFDEVLSQLDSDGKKRVKDILIRLKQEGKCVVMVEHDLKNLDIADRVLLLSGGCLKAFNGNME